MGCVCVGSNKIKINSTNSSEKKMEICLNQEDIEDRKLQKELEENVLIIISSDDSIDNIKDTYNGNFLGYDSFISDLES